MADTSIDTLGPRVVDTTKQLRFAGILALTRTAVAAKDNVKANLQKEFTLRNRWTQGGIRITPAKREPQPFSEVWSADWFIAQHETGIRRKPPGTGDFQIPSFIRQVAGLPEDKLIKRNLRAKSLFDKIQSGARLPKIAGHRPFLAIAVDAGLGIFVRSSGDRLPIRLLYKIQDEPVEIDKNVWFFPVVDKTFDQEFDGIYSKAVVEALRTARG